MVLWKPKIYTMSWLIQIMVQYFKYFRGNSWFCNRCYHIALFPYNFNYIYDLSPFQSICDIFNSRNNKIGLFFYWHHLLNSITGATNILSSYMVGIISFLLLILNCLIPKQAITTAEMTVLFLTELVLLSPVFLSHSVHLVITAKYTVLVLKKKQNTFLFHY